MKRTIWINLILGVWLVLAPVVTGFDVSSIAALSSDGAIGIVLFVCSWWILQAATSQTATARVLSVVEVLCGIWLIIAPLALGYRGDSLLTMNDLIVGSSASLVALITTWGPLITHVRV